MTALRRLSLVGSLALLACGQDPQRLAEQISGGSVARGRAAFDRYGCGTCHELQGKANAQGHVGPALHDFALQQALPGGLPNTPDALVRWLREPRTVEPRTTMPNLGVTERDARDLAAFLYTIR
jgi:cytochrome c2